MNQNKRRTVTLLHLLLFAAVCSAASPSDNVILIVADGLRWQEVFRGVDMDMATTVNKVTNPEAFRREFDAPTTEARRARLMPFVWSHIVRTGQIYGNRDKGSIARVANGMWFSYPGYSEMIVGYPDDERVKSNDKLQNPNESVFEWLSGKPGMKGRVAAFGAWDVFPYIFNSERCGFPVDGGDKPFEPATGVTCGMDMINRIRTTTPYRWGSAAFDSLVYPMFVEYLKQQKPKLMFLALGEPDEWGHEGDYPRYLESARRVDAFLAELWKLTMEMAEYRDKTTFIFVADHGRGDNSQHARTWNGHGRDYAGSDAIYFMIWGSAVPAKGEISGGPEVTLSQTAATVAAASGYDYPASNAKAAKSVAGSILGGK